MSGPDFRSLTAQELQKASSPTGRDEFRVFLLPEVFDQVVKRGAGAQGVEVGGVLVGQVLQDDAGPYLIVEATVDAAHSLESHAGLTFTHATWDHIHKEMDRLHPQKKVVGWYHTHPGFGIFLSDQDVFIHKSFFDQPFHVALVYDPTSREHGIFGWRDGAPWRLRRYFVGADACSWDGPREAPSRKEGPADPESKSREGAPAAAPARAEDEERGWGWAGWVLVGLLGVVAGGLGGYWLAGNRAEKLESEYQKKLLEARQAGVQDAVRGIRTDLFALFRSIVSDEGERAVLDDLAKRLDLAAARLAAVPVYTAPASGTPGAPAAGSDPLDAARKEVAAAQAAVRQYREQHVRIQSVMRSLDEQAQTGPLDPRGIASEFGRLRSQLGQAYLETAGIAGRMGDLDRARRLLGAASITDPEGAPRYQRALQELDPNAKVPGATP
jgi:proteasome lid subunit RPN8/RPN11